MMFIWKRVKTFFPFITADSANSMFLMANGKSGEDQGTDSCLKMCVNIIR